MTLLFHAIDNVGLGHLSRALGIAEAVHELDPSRSIVFITEASDSRMLDEYSFAYYQIPNRDALLTDRRWTRFPATRLLTCWSDMLASIVEAHQPSVIVYDTYIWNELQEIVRRNRVRQVLVMRQQRNFSTFFRDNLNTLSDIDIIALPHDQNEVTDTAIPSELASKVFFCGNLLRRSKRNIRPDLSRSDFGLDNDLFTIVITNGGGNAVVQKSDEFPEAVIDALQRAGSFLPEFQAIYVAGPLARPRKSSRKLERGRLTIKEYEADILGLYSIANIAIGRGGYNTVLELCEVGVPAICVPARRDLDDQEKRIREAAQYHSNIRLAKIDGMDIAAQVRNLAKPPYWRYVPKVEFDQIAANKSALAKRVLELR